MTTKPLFTNTGWGVWVCTLLFRSGFKKIWMYLFYYMLLNKPLFIKPKCHYLWFFQIRIWRFFLDFWKINFGLKLTWLVVLDCLPNVPNHCASSVGIASPLSDDQVGNHWSEQINSRHVHLLTILSGSPSVCVCVYTYPVQSHHRSPSAHTRWLPSGLCRLTHRMIPCVGVLCVCMSLWDSEWPLNVTFVIVYPWWQHCT